MDPREVAEKAIKEIKGVPPKLVMYSIGGAVAIILVVGAAMAWHSYSQNTDEEGSVPKATAASATDRSCSGGRSRSDRCRQSARGARCAARSAGGTRGGGSRHQDDREEHQDPHREEQEGGRACSRGRGRTRAIVVDSTPEGAQIQLDGRADPSWVTPFNSPGLTPGSHTVVSANRAMDKKPAPWMLPREQGFSRRFT